MSRLAGGSIPSGRLEKNGRHLLRSVRIRSKSQHLLACWWCGVAAKIGSGFLSLSSIKRNSWPNSMAALWTFALLMPHNGEVDETVTRIGTSNGRCPFEPFSPHPRSPIPVPPPSPLAISRQAARTGFSPVKQLRVGNTRNSPKSPKHTLTCGWTPCKSRAASSQVQHSKTEDRAWISSES